MKGESTLAKQLQYGLSIDQVENAEVYVQGGALGQIGYIGFNSASNTNNYADSIETFMSASNYYSGSFSYELSWLDKDHTLITNLNKDAELFDGIGVGRANRWFEGFVRASG